MKELFNKLDLGDVVSIENIDSSQNSTYKVTTLTGKYLLKKYSSDVIKDEIDLMTRKKQINISKILNSNGILTILPIEFYNENFIIYNDEYYLIYNYLEYKVLTEEELTVQHIKKLASTLASIHKLNINCDLPIQYKEININYEIYLDKFKNEEYALKLYELLLNNKNELSQLINECNLVLPNIKNDLCISHNDYKLKNILWNKNQMYLIDFDATCLSNPIVFLAESSFALTRQENSINFDFYIEYIKKYNDIYGKSKTNYKDALMCAMNGKLQWLEYLLSDCSENNIKRVDDCISMINELMLFINNKDKLLKIYNEIIF